MKVQVQVHLHTLYWILKKDLMMFMAFIICSDHGKVIHFSNENVPLAQAEEILRKCVKMSIDT